MYCLTNRIWNDDSVVCEHAYETPDAYKARRAITQAIRNYAHTDTLWEGILTRDDTPIVVADNFSDPCGCTYLRCNVATDDENVQAAVSLELKGSRYGIVELTLERAHESRTVLIGEVEYASTAEARHATATLDEWMGDLDLDAYLGTM